MGGCCGCVSNAEASRLLHQLCLAQQRLEEARERIDELGKVCCHLQMQKESLAKSHTVVMANLDQQLVSRGYCLSTLHPEIHKTKKEKNI